MIQQVIIKFSEKNMQTMALKVFKQNAFFEHHKNIFLVMLADDDMTIRCLNVSKILNLKENKMNIILKNLLIIAINLMMKSN